MSCSESSSRSDGDSSNRNPEPKVLSPKTTALSYKVKAEKEDEEPDTAEDDQQKKERSKWTPVKIMELVHAVTSTCDPSHLSLMPYDQVSVNWVQVAGIMKLPRVQCEEKWGLLLNSTRRFRTLSEVITDVVVQHHKSDLFQHNKHSDQVMSVDPKKTKSIVKSNHPVTPKLSAYSIFCEEKAKALSENGLQKMIKLGSLWKAMDEQDKARYQEICDKGREEYMEEVKEYAAVHPEDTVIQKTLTDLIRGANSSQEDLNQTLPVVSNPMSTMKRPHSDTVATKAPREKKKREGGGGNSTYSRPCLLSADLATFMGTDKLARNEVVTKMWEIVKERKLQDPKDKRFMICDEQLQKIFGRKRVQKFGMMKYLASHIFKEGSSSIESVITNSSTESAHAGPNSDLDLDDADLDLPLADLKQKKSDLFQHNKHSDQVMSVDPKKTKSIVKSNHPVTPKLSAYSIFCEEKAKALPENGLQKMIKLGSLWKAMDEQDKGREEYMEEVKEYAAVHPEDTVIQKTLTDLIRGANSSQEDLNQTMPVVSNPMSTMKRPHSDTVSTESAHAGPNSDLALDDADLDLPLADLKQKKSDLFQHNKHSDQVMSVDPKKTKSVVKSNHPVKPKLSAYSIFCEEKAKALPENGRQKIIKLGSLWKAMDEQDKARYQEICDKGREEYAEEVKEYAVVHPEDTVIQKTLADLIRALM